MRFIGRREGVDAAARRADGVGRRADRARTRRITLFVAFNYGGRAEILDAAQRFTGTHEEEFRALPVRARDARPRPDHPHQRRAAAVQLPAVAVRLLRAGLPRRAVARLHAARRSRSRSPSTPRAGAASAGGEGRRWPADRHTPGEPPAAPTRPATPAARRARPRARPAPPRAERAARRARTSARACSSRSRRSRVALFLVLEGGLVFALGLFVLGGDLHARAVRRCTSARTRCAWRASSALAGLLAGGALRRPVPGAARRRAARCRCCSG